MDLENNSKCGEHVFELGAVVIILENFQHTTLHIGNGGSPIHIVIKLIIENSLTSINGFLVVIRHNLH